MIFTSSFTVPNSRCVYGGMFFGIYRNESETIIQIRGRKWRQEREEDFQSIHGCTYEKCQQYQKEFGHKGCPMENCQIKQRYRKEGYI